MFKDRMSVQNPRPMNKLVTRPYDVVEYLRDQADVAAYLEAALEDGDPN